MKREDLVFILLVLATLASWWAGERSSASAWRLDRAMVLVVLGLAAFKGALIALDYMELRQAPAVWRRAVMGWLSAVLALIAGAVLL